MAADEDIQFIHGVPSSRPELRGRSYQAISQDFQKDQNRTFIQNLELCSQAICNEETLSVALQRTFLMPPKTPYMMRMEKALFDLTSASLTTGIFHCSVFKINEKFYLRYMDSGVLKGFFLDAAFNKLKEYVSSVTSPVIADMLFWICIFTTEDQYKHQERYMDKLNAKRNRRELTTTVKDTGRRFYTLFETNTMSFCRSHEGFMAQVTESEQSGSEECHFIGSISYILRKTNPKAKSNTNDRLIIHAVCIVITLSTDFIMAVYELYPGPYCKAVSLTKDRLRDCDSLQFLSGEQFTNGLVHELTLFFKNDEELLYCVQRLNANFEGVNPKSFSTKVKRLLDIKKKLGRKYKAGGFKSVKECLDQQFLSPSKLTIPSTKSALYKEVEHVNEGLLQGLQREVEFCKPCDTTVSVESNHDANLSKKSNLLSYEISKKEKHVQKLNSDILELEEKLKNGKSLLGHYSVRNVNKRDDTARKNLHALRDNQRKVSKLTSAVDSLSVKLEEAKAHLSEVREENKGLISELADIKSERQALLDERKKKLSAQKTASHWKKKATQLKEEIKENCKQSDTISSEKVDNSDRSVCKHDDCDFNEELANRLQTKDDGTYSDNVRLCVVELAALEVATEKISPVISAVVKHIVGHSLNKCDLPNKTTTQTIVDEGHFLAKTYISEKLDDTEHWGLNRDGTSRQKKKLLDTSVTLSNGEIISLGFTRVAHEDAKTINRVTKEHLEELAKVNSSKTNTIMSTGSDSSLTPNEQQDYVVRALERLAFAMSDRAANEKLATKLLAEWRDRIIKEFRGNDVTDMVHSFHCMAHVLLGFHQYSTKDIKVFEKELAQDHGPLGRDKLQMFKFWRSNEAVVERVVRTTSDTFGPVGDHLGLRDTWEAHCKSTGTKSTIGNYKDNRFNALFQTAAEVYVHKRDFLQVLCATEKPNKKLQSVKADLECPLVGILLQSFGLMYLKVTGPYWNMITSGEIPYLKLYPYIQDLSSYLKKCAEDPAHILVMDGHWMTQDTFGFINIPHKEMLEELYTISEDHRDVLFTAIKIICHAMSNTVDKQLSDFLEDGKYSSQPTEEDMKRTSFSQVTNLGCEHHFGDLDSSQRRRPHSSLHHHSSIQLLKRNRTGLMKWVEGMDSTSLTAVMKTARKEGKILRSIHTESEKNVLREIHQELTAQPKSRKKRKNSSNHDERDSQRCRDGETELGEEFDLVTVNMCFKENNYVAVAYQDNWYPGIILSKTDEENARVKFMQPCHQEGYFKWPTRDDIQQVNIEFVLKDDIAVECQNSGRQWFIPSFSEIKSIYEKYSVVNF